ncbi:hypothetical protein [Nitrosospira multiformis]|uniref:hypothetical protein n=1 Tax=Nitrosospira multiformis TaxID=1231 RepID=UPI000942639D|nr:hypothetical protein [Nitrosospira multiformis]
MLAPVPFHIHETSAYEIAAAAGKGFISGFAVTAAWLVTRNAATAEAIGGVVDEVIKVGLNGKLPDSPTGVIKSVVAGAVLGKDSRGGNPIGS